MGTLLTCGIIMMLLKEQYVIKPLCIFVCGIVFIMILTVAISGMIQIRQIQINLAHMVKTTDTHNKQLTNLKKLYLLSHPESKSEL